MYEEPSSRFRADSDVLVREESFGKAVEILRSQGFKTSLSGLSIEAQGATSFSLTDGRGLNHEIDLHFRINSSQLIAKLFPHDELLERSVFLPKIGIAARGLGSIDALLVACFHRLIHRRSPYFVAGKAYLSSDRLIWLCDIKFLHDRLDGAEKQLLVQLALAKGLSAVLADGLMVADQWLGIVDQDLISELRSSECGELPYRYLASGSIRRIIFDLASSSRKRQALLEIVTPSREYMEKQYGARMDRSLFLAYVRRAIYGILKAARR
jgi:hypothetical protein